MPKRISEQELDAILAVVAAHPCGVQVGAIRKGLPYDLPPRMLQRRLALLVEQKRLFAEGRGKGRRYRAPVSITGPEKLRGDSSTVEGRGEVHVPISAEGQKVKQAVRAPIQARRPVGYQHTFLDDYEPNVTYYLPAAIRRHLLEIGRPPDGERPAGTYARAKSTCDAGGQPACRPAGGRPPAAYPGGHRRHGLPSAGGATAHRRML